MKVGIMQPYFLPYLGYFQLMHSVDVFVLYDNVQYTKKGWINRNRMLVNGSEMQFGLPVKKGPDHALIKERSIADPWAEDGPKLLRRIHAAYGKAPFYGSVFPLIESIVRNPVKDLFEFIFFSLDQLRQHMGITTKLVVSSHLQIDPQLRAAERVIALCHELGGDHYINPSGGVNLYDRDRFEQKGLKLSFLYPHLVPYAQFGGVFVPGLSIMDVLMFNSPERVRSMLEEYELA